MALPKHTRKSKKVHGVTCYALNRGQTLELSGAADAAEKADDATIMERALIAAGTNSSAAQADSYYANAPAGEVQDVVQTIMELSGMVDLPKESSAA